uniref:Uncharacterized protein n=1 Tax=Myotis myotis TaxID=51298 RepID=A0A7J7Z426_MYOMY|nr:hypothetical protein mMyoMyo1_010419 [Myotis myotis]
MSRLPPWILPFLEMSERWPAWVMFPASLPACLPACLCSSPPRNCCLLSPELLMPSGFCFHSRLWIRSWEAALSFLCGGHSQSLLLASELTSLETPGSTDGLLEPAQTATKSDNSLGRRRAATPSLANWKAEETRRSGRD